VNGLSANVTWNAAQIGDQFGNNAQPAANVTYYVYAAPASFQTAAGAVPVVVTTACGLIRWAAVTEASPQAVVGQTWLVVDGLQPDTQYQFNVMAECGPACWLANPQQLPGTPRRPALSAELQERIAAGESQLRVPGYSVQRTAYAVSPGSTGAAPVPPKQVLTVGAGVAIGAAALAVVAGATVCFFYRRSKLRRGDFDYQYNQLEMPNAMDTISTPVYVRSGGGMLSGIRNMLSAPPGTGGGGGGSSLNRGGGGGGGAGLATSEFSELEDRVAAYM
jgi:hypothetical protein